jgi:glycosyltransferase involved in cell wall biosynthesis
LKSARPIFVISSFPPQPCGVANYAAAQAHNLETTGRSVVRIVIGPGSGEVSLGDSIGICSFLQLGWALATRRPDSINLHYTPEIFYRNSSRFAPKRHVYRVLEMAFIATVGLTRLMGLESVAVIHEAKPCRQSWRFLERCRQMALRCFSQFEFHTNEEVSMMFPGKRPASISIVDPGRFFSRQTPASRDEARRRLKIDEKKQLLLSIGFIHPNKGLLEFAQAIAGASRDDLCYWTVGQVREKSDQKAIEYLAKLHELADHCNRLRVLDQYVNDEDFELWLTSADYIVLPYLETSSSGIAAKAKNFGLRIIYSSHSNLNSQLVGYSLGLSYIEAVDFLAGSDLPRAEGGYR